MWLSVANRSKQASEASAPFKRYWYYLEYQYPLALVGWAERKRGKD